MRTRSLVILGVLALTSLSGAVGAADPTPEQAKQLQHKLAGYFPRNIAGWTLSAEPEFFEADNLWEYIDGAAEEYLAYDFRQVATAIYQSSDGKIVVDLYEMGEPINAFGIYSAGRTPQVKMQPLGLEGYVAGAELNFCQGPVYAHIASLKPKPELLPAVLQVGRAVSALMPPAPPLPQLRLLPKEGQIPQTQRFYLRDALGQAALRNAVAAKFTAGPGKRDTELVVATYQTPAEAQAAAQELTSYLQKDAKSTRPLTETGRLFTGHPYYGTLAVSLLGRHVIVAQPVSDADQALNLMRRAEQQVKPRNQ